MTRRVANQPATLKPIVSASELARMGLCERMVVLEHRFGQRLSVAGLAATARGRRAHARFLREGKRAPGMNRSGQQGMSAMHVASSRSCAVRGGTCARRAGGSGCCSVSADIVATVLIALAGAWCCRWAYRRIGAACELPDELLGAELAYAERTFRLELPQIRLSARVDRAYRAQNGVVTPAELKTRRIHRPYLSDVIELSVQRLVLMSETGESVARYAYVLVQGPGSGPRRTASSCCRRRRCSRSLLGARRFCRGTRRQRLRATRVSVPTALSRSNVVDQTMGRHRGDRRTAR